jgi:para-nitrobenzyl esterase
MFKHLTAVRPSRVALFSAACIFALASTAHAETPQVRTDKGLATGTTEGKTFAFLGIPYAAPPIGELRLRPPQPHERWSAPLNTTKFASQCPQATGGNEDCLYLNVWTPHQGGEPLPVMLYIHGGAFQVGSASKPYFDGATLAETGHVVVVTINYRLGALGFLTSPALDAESHDHISGNYGIEDQQAALRWVRKNIAGFGGNPANITIFGQSAGANSVDYQLTSPDAAHLFTRAIIESPVSNGSASTLAVSETGSSANIISKLGCSGASDVAACLRAAPVSSFLSAGSANPVQDGVVIPLQPIDAFHSGAFNRVPVIIGSNHDEFTVFVYQLELPPNPALTVQAYAAQIASVYGSNAAAVLAEYPASAYPSPIQALATVETDSNVACPTDLARIALSNFVPTFSYEFNEPNPAQGQLLGPPVPGLDYGDYHTAELPYVFGVSAPNGTPLTGKDLALSNKMIGYWSNMALTGNPNQPAFDGAGPYWPNYRLNQSIVSLQDTITRMQESQFISEHHCSFWNNLPPRS